METRLTIIEYTEAMTEQVAAFNARLQAGGATSRFPTSHVPAWLPKIAGRKLYQQYYLATDAASAVRGAYILKHQDFLLGGQTLSMADFHLPISEGIVDANYRSVGVLVLLDAIRKQPLLYGLGIGSYDEPLSKLLAASGWRLFSVPFFFSIVRPYRVLRQITHLRKSFARRCFLDAIALSGLGWAAVKALRAVRYRQRPVAPDVDVETVDEFSDWVDPLWDACKADYGMSAVRDGQTLRILYPKEKEHFIRLRVTRGGKTIGWAVLLNTQLSAHRHFGDMRLGSIVDGFSAAADAVHVAGAAAALLRKQNVDLIVSNQAHSAWCAALDGCGFMRGPSNFLFAASKELTRRLEKAGVKDDDIHMTRGDGDGPINL